MCQCRSSIHSGRKNMIKKVSACVAVAFFFTLLGSAGANQEGVATSSTVNNLPFSPAEVRQIMSHGPWPLPNRPDLSNRASGNRHAIELGEKLFFDRRMSSTGTVACGSCHQPDRHWTDGEARAAALGHLDRNTPHLLNLRHTRWFGWDGASDSLWSQIIRPVLDSRELASSPAQIAGVIRSHAAFSCKYEKALGTSPRTDDDDTVLVGVSKVLAAFVETLQTERTRFDDFRDAVGRGDQAGMSEYGDVAQRGLKIFMGKGNCTACHAGPLFTNGEFHNPGVPYAIAPGRDDTGRFGGAKAVSANRFNLLSRFNDDPTRANAAGTKQVIPEPRNVGEFRVPSLRHAGLSAPYMHNGSIDTLRNVVKHYSDMNIDRLRGDAAQRLKPLQLNARETDDLLVFLESLTNYRTPTWRETPHMSACQ